MGDLVNDRFPGPTDSRWAAARLASSVARPGLSAAKRLAHARPAARSFGPSATPCTEHLEILQALGITALGITSYMMVPLVVRERTLGVISFLSSAPDRHYGPLTSPSPRIWRDVPPWPWANARLYRKSERQRREAEALTDVNRLITETLEPDAVGQRILESMRQLANARMAALYRLDPGSGDLHLFAGTGPEGRLEPGAAQGNGHARPRDPRASADHDAGCPE